MHPGVWGAVVGGVVGLAGGVLGTWASVKSAQSDRERRFVVRAALAMGLGISIFVSLLVGLPKSVQPSLWVAYPILLTVTITWVNRTIARLREEQAQA